MKSFILLGLATVLVFAILNQPPAAGIRLSAPEWGYLTSIDWRGPPRDNHGP
jgi:hypothetical protein